MKDEELKEHVSVITIDVQDPETKQPWGIWNKYIVGQFSSESPLHDIDVDRAKAEIINTVNYKILGAKVTCCLSSSGYDKSILDKLKKSSQGFFIESHIQENHD